MVTCSFNNSLALFPWPAWVEREKGLARLPTTDPASRALLEMELGNADERTLDSQGRLLLTPTLRDYAGLKREVVLFGQHDRLMLCSQTTWKAKTSTWDKVLNNPDQLVHLSGTRL